MENIATKEYVIVDKKTLKVDVVGSGLHYIYSSKEEAQAYVCDHEMVMEYNQYLNLREIQDIVDDANIDALEPTFEDFVDKANKHMAIAMNDGYYNAVMVNDNHRIDEEQVLNDNIDEAIRVLKLAKRFASKVGF
jgi:hypothetical protein